MTSPHRFYEPPEDRAGTVFEPSDETFGPIMAAIQAGEFGAAARKLDALSIPQDVTRQTDSDEFETCPYYNVSWSSPIQASSPLDAAKEAPQQIRDGVTIFTVESPDGTRTVVDIEYDEIIKVEPA